MPSLRLQAKLSFEPSNIPIGVASILGLFYGVGILLMRTVAVGQLGWPDGGLREWCRIIAVISKHIVYATIYCATVITMEVQP